jgi:hypothetical protein
MNQGPDQLENELSCREEDLNARIPRRLFAIGDIHGCSVALRTLIYEIDPQPEDTIVVLGDVIDWGPDSRKCVQQLIDLSSRPDFRGYLFVGIDRVWPAMMVLPVRIPDSSASRTIRTLTRVVRQRVGSMPPAHTHQFGQHDVCYVPSAEPLRCGELVILDKFVEHRL